MKQTNAGVMPAERSEITVMVVWPSIAAYGAGRLLGRLCGIEWPGVYIFKLGNLLALLSIPLGLVLYFCRLLPRIGSHYRLSNRRIAVHSGLLGPVVRSLELDRFDTIQLMVRPGQEWFDAGDLAFLEQGIEQFRLEGVSRPAAFRQTCWKSHLAYVGVQQVLAQQAARIGA